MRIALVAQEEPFYLPPAVLAICQTRLQDMAAVIVLKSFNETMPQTAARLYDFYGPSDFARLVLRYAGAKVCDRIIPPDRSGCPHSVRGIAARLNLPLYQPEGINSPEFVHVLQNEIRPDVILSIAASQIFKSSVLSTPPLGCINVHSAPLPKYQGMMPVFWTLYHDEPQGCVTVHYMVEKLDAGDIILQRPVSILPSDSLEDVMIRCKTVGVTAVLDAIEMIEQGTINATPMPSDGASYFSFPKRSHAAKLRRSGRRLLR